jgi:hypothetical protein
LDLLHTRFVDQAPAQVHAALLDEGTYLCSPRTMYRLLGAADEIKERRAQVRRPLSLAITGPARLWVAIEPSRADHETSSTVQRLERAVSVRPELIKADARLRIGAPATRPGSKIVGLQVVRGFGRERH